MKKYVYLLTILIGQILYSQQIIELDSVTIASRTKENIKSIGKVVYKINATDLAKFGGQTVAQVLNTVPGIEINNAQGNFGADLGYYVRGGRTKDVLVMINGIPVGDPSKIDFSYDLNALPLEQVESIEVLKGGNSALYGTSASAGVINITLKKNSNKEIALNIGASSGSFGTNEQNLQLSGKVGTTSYNIIGNNFTTKGFSVAKGNGFEKDAGERQNIMAQLGFNLNENISVKPFFQFNNHRYGFDGGSFTDELNLSASIKEFSYGVQAEVKQSNKANLLINTRANIFDRFTGYNFYKANNYFASLTQTFEVTNFLKILGGIELNQQNQTILDLNKILIFSPRNLDFTTSNPYAGMVLSLGDFKLIGNGRLNIHSNHPNKYVYSVTPSYLLKLNNDYSVSFKGNIGTAYITPTLYQIFGGDGLTLPAIISLTPQESLTYEGGLSFYAKDKLTFNSTFFYREDSNFIDYNYDPTTFTGVYFNQTNTLNTKGVELDLKYTPNKNITLGSAYTYSVLDNDANQDRIPINKVSSFLSLNDLLLKGNSFSFMHNFVGDRTDAGNVLNQYHLLGLNTTQKINDKLKLFLTVNNLTNEDYFEAFGYTTRGINYTFGFNYNF